MTKDNKVNVNQLEEYLKQLILDELRKREVEVSESDAQQIVKAIASQIDDFVSERMKQHFVEIAQFILQKFGKEKT